MLDQEQRLIDLLDLATTAQSQSPIDTIVRALAGNRADGRADLESRKAKHDAVNLEDQLHRIRALASIHRNEFELLLLNEWLDEYYTSLQRAGDWIAQLQELRSNDKTPNDLIDLLHNKRAEVLDFYVSYFRGPRCCGDSDVLSRPDFIFILGTISEPERASRVNASLEALKRNEASHVILSGGGWDSSVSEARQMKRYIDNTDPIPDDRVILEEDSLDTVGNAVFGRLTLMTRGLLDKRKPVKVCVVTSAYHAPRALSIFRRVFSSAAHSSSPQAEVALLPVIVYDDEEAARRAKNSLDSEYEANTTSFAISNYISGDVERIDHGEVITIFYQMMIHHPLYRYRHDLIRKFSSALA